MAEAVDTSTIKQWRSIVTLLAFVIANIIVLFPFHIPIYIPTPIVKLTRRSAVKLRLIPSTSHHDTTRRKASASDGKIASNFVVFRFPVNFITAPLIADLFLLAISAIGRNEVHDGTVGTHGINPLDIMIFFITLAYIAISIDASGLIRWLAFKVLQWGGEVGHRLFFYLYAFFFVLGSFVGNDPIILSGTAFLAYMTRVSENITSPRAWIHTQFAVANIASAILVSSNPTNLVLAGAFEIKFIDYTVNMIVPVIITGIVLFPFLLYVVFADEKLIPSSIKMHQLSDAARQEAPVNPNIPHVRRQAESQGTTADGTQERALSLEEIMNPFLDKKGAAFGGIIMAGTLITVLALNAASSGTGEHPVFYVTLPAAFVMFCWDVAFGWLHREETRETARLYQEKAENRAERQREAAEVSQQRQSQLEKDATAAEATTSDSTDHSPTSGAMQQVNERSSNHLPNPIPNLVLSSTTNNSPIILSDNASPVPDPATRALPANSVATPHADELSPLPDPEMNLGMEKRSLSVSKSQKEKTNLVSIAADVYGWLQVTFPTVMTVMSHLPFALVPFAFSMFVLVQALVSTGWVNVFGYGWYHWSKRTGTVGSIGGMGFLSVILCNFSGTNIGTTILLSRIIQAWLAIHEHKGTVITNRTFWGTVYSMALGVNYGAFSTAFSASLAGLLWRDILARKHIHVKSHEFARVNFPIIAISMAVGCLILVGEIYLTRDSSPYEAK